MCVKMVGSQLSLVFVEEEILFFLVPINRFRVESVDSNTSVYDNEKKLRSTFVKFAQHSINTINELPERSLDDDR